MDFHASNQGAGSKSLGSGRKVLHEQQPSHSSTLSDATAVELVPIHNVPVANTYDSEPTSTLDTPTVSDVEILTKFEQHRTSLMLTVIVILLLGASNWFIYTEFISEEPLNAHLQLSTGHTITIVNILSHVNIFLGNQLLESAFEALRWSLASSEKGVSIATFLGLSRATGFVGAADLLRIPGRHRILCSQKILFKAFYLLLGLVLLINPIYTTIYSPDNSIRIPIIGGLTAVNADLQVPSSMIDVYYQMFAKGMLMDVTLVKNIAPLICTGLVCTSIFLPGGLDLVRLINGGPNATIFQQPTTGGQSTFIVSNAPGYHLEFFPIPMGWVFDEAKHCVTYVGSNNEAIRICIAAVGTQIYAGWTICPSDLFVLGGGLCLNDTSWTNRVDVSTVLVIRKRYATVAYDVGNFSIRSIESIGEPEPITPTFITDTVSNLTKIFGLAFTSIPATFNTSDENFETYASSWSNFYMLGWALRLYQDDYPNYPGGPLDVLKSFLTMPIQFSTIAWETASWSTLPSDLQTTGTYATSSPRVLGKLWVLIVFATGTGSLMLLSTTILVYVVVWGPVTPNSSRWPELDILAKFRLAIANSSIGARPEDIEALDLKDFARQNGLGNGTSEVVRACLEGQRVFVRVENGAIVLAMRADQAERLKYGQRYS